MCTDVRHNDVLLCLFRNKRDVILRLFCNKRGPRHVYRCATQRRIIMCLLQKSPEQPRALWRGDLDMCTYGRRHNDVSVGLFCNRALVNSGEVGGWGRDPKKCTGRDWGMGSSTISWKLRPVVKYHLRRGVGFMKFPENGSRPQPPTSHCMRARI